MTRKEEIKKEIKRLVEQRLRIFNMTLTEESQRLLQVNTQKLSFTTGFSERTVAAIWTRKGCEAELERYNKMA